MDENIRDVVSNDISEFLADPIIFIKEKRNIRQYACVLAVVVGIVILGISEGLAEA